MTKKDYEAIAACFRNEEWNETAFILAKRISEVMMDDNPRFDRARFMAACRGEDSTDSAGRKVTYAR